MIKSAPNPEGFAAYMNCCKLANDDESVKQVARNQRIAKGWTDEMLNMYANLEELAATHPYIWYSTGIEGVSKIDENLYRGTFQSNTWAELKSSYGDALQEAIDAAQAQIDSLNG